MWGETIPPLHQGAEMERSFVGSVCSREGDNEENPRGNQLKILKKRKYTNDFMKNKIDPSRKTGRQASSDPMVAGRGWRGGRFIGQAGVEQCILLTFVAGKAGSQEGGVATTS